MLQRHLLQHLGSGLLRDALHCINQVLFQVQNTYRVPAVAAEIQRHLFRMCRRDSYLMNSALQIWPVPLLYDNMSPLKIPKRGQHRSFGTVTWWEMFVYGCEATSV